MRNVRAYPKDESRIHAEARPRQAGSRRNAALEQGRLGIHMHARAREIRPACSERRRLRAKRIAQLLSLCVHNQPMDHSDDIRARTELMRTSVERPYWVRLRDLLHERGINPNEAVMAQSFPDDGQLEFGIVVTPEAKLSSLTTTTWASRKARGDSPPGLT